jgi:hypothetical protein
MEMRFTIDFRGAEAVRSARALRRELHGSSRWTYMLAAALPPIALLGVAATGVYLGWWGESYFTVMIGAAAIAFLWTRLLSPLLGQKLLKPIGGLLEGRMVDYEFGEDGYRIRTETFEGFQRWAGVDRIVDAKGSILFVLGLNAHFLPDRLFASPDARREFLDWALEKISTEARARSGIRLPKGPARS